MFKNALCFAIHFQSQSVNIINKEYVYDSIKLITQILNNIKLCEQFLLFFFNFQVSNNSQVLISIDRSESGREHRD